MRVLPGAQLLLVAGVAEREHLLGVLDLLEAVERRRPDPLGRRVGGAQLRVVGLDRPQLVEQGVVLVVADLRFVEDVVEPVVVLQLAPQLRGALYVPARSRRRSARPPASPRSPSRAAASRPPWSVRSKWIGVTAIRPCATANEVGPLDLLVARLPAVDLVAAAAVRSSPTSFSSSL